MAKVRIAQVIPASVAEAEACWYDTARWPAWVDGLARVITVDGAWPRAGSTVVWESGPSGRGRVSERVISYEPLRGQAVEVQDDAIRGRQTVSFTPAPDGVEVALALDYRIKRRSPLTPVIDTLFVRGPMTTSLVKTLGGFAAALVESRNPERGIA